MSDRRLAILSYHKIGEPLPGVSKHTWYVPEREFAAQLRFLIEAGWEPIDHDAFLGALDRPETVPERSVLITFDDAYRSVLECALPHMSELGFPGVVFVPTEYVGGSSGFDSLVRTGEPPAPICSWEQLEQLERGGVSAQSHGVLHRALSELPPEQVEHELAHSKQELEHRLDKQVSTYSYPYGDAGSDAPAIDAALRCSGYRAACLFEGGALELPVPDRYRLGRVPVYFGTDLEVELG